MFYEQLLCAQIPNAQNQQSSYQCLFVLSRPMCIKAALKMLMKLTTAVDFTNILQAVFSFADLKSAKRQSSHPCLFAFLESACIKAAHKMFVKLTPKVMAIHVVCN
jgi:hypothetical protein